MHKHGVCGCNRCMLAQIIMALNSQAEFIKRIEAAMARNQEIIMADIQKLAEDQAAEAAAVAANTAAIATLASSNATIIATLNEEIATLKAASPDLDLSVMEAATAQLLKNNASATTLSAPLPTA